MKISGIYKITNTITGDFYIGSSKNVKKRWYNHRCPSKWEQSPGMKLYQAFIKYGLNSFTFEIIEETDNLKEREQYWIDQLNPSYNNLWANGWNIERYKAYKGAHRDERLAKNKSYYNRLCLYKDKILTLGALSSRFYHRGIPQPTQEAKTYLLENINE